MEEQSLGELGALVVDELHMVADDDRWVVKATSLPLRCDSLCRASRVRARQASSSVPATPAAASMPSHASLDHPRARLHLFGAWLVLAQSTGSIAFTYIRALAHSIACRGYLLELLLTKLRFSTATMETCTGKKQGAEGGSSAAKTFNACRPVFLFLETAKHSEALLTTH